MPRSPALTTTILAAALGLPACDDAGSQPTADASPGPEPSPADAAPEADASPEADAAPEADASMAVTEEAADATFDGAGELEADALCGVRKLANTADDAALTEMGVAPLARASLLAFRAGPDGAEGTADDGFFTSLADLDAVDHTGPRTLARLVSAAATDYVCGQVPVQLLAFNDFHGNLLPPSGAAGTIQPSLSEASRVEAGGVEFLATHIADLRAGHPNTIVVAAGDLIGASPLLSALFHDEPSIEALNLVGLEVTAVGNHEFDEGVPELLRMRDGGCHPVDGCQDGDDFAGADFPILGANVVVDETGETLLPSTFVKRFGSVRVGFIGLTLEGTPSVVIAGAVDGLTFLDEAETINARAAELQAQGIETIVVLIHEGGFTFGRYNECLGLSGAIAGIVDRLDASVDVVVSGHTHEAYNCVVNGKIVTSGAHAGRIVSDIDLSLDEATQDVAQATAGNIIVTRDVARAPALTALIARYEALADPLSDRVVGRISADLLRDTDADGEVSTRPTP